jgi:hypothetical protein
MGFSKLQLRVNCAIWSSAPVIRLPPAMSSMVSLPARRAASPATINFPFLSYPAPRASASSTCARALLSARAPTERYNRRNGERAFTLSVCCHSLNGPRAFCRPPLDLGSGLVDDRDEVLRFPSRRRPTLHLVRFLGYG